jgi:hypothetical protein
MGKRHAVAVLVLAVAAFAVPSIASAALTPIKNDPSGATFVGKGGYSADGLGQVAPGGTVQAQVPAGSKVEHAYLYGSYTPLPPGPPPDADLTISFDGRNVTLTKLATIVGTVQMTSARADVTAQVAAKVGAGAATPFNFTIGNDPTTLDGIALVVIYSNPGLPTTTIAVLEGGAEVGGDTASFRFSKPIDPTLPNFSAVMSLGIGFSYQGEPGHVCGTAQPAPNQLPQYSTVDINGRRLTSCAGSYDDGAAVNGALVTVGGVGDAIDNPSDPNQKPADGSSPRVQDDELYNLQPFLKKGDTQLTITTTNASRDDLVFVAVISVTGEAGVSTGGGGGGAQLPPPVVGKTFNVAVVSGIVRCRPRGSGAFRPLTKPEQLRVGSECDATKGRIRLTSAAGRATKSMRLGGGAATPTQTADFYRGQFVVTQQPASQPVTQLKLSGGDFAKKCGKKTRGVGAVEADPVVRRLWGSGKGRFRTRGRYASATVQGTTWETQDRCRSTAVHVVSGTATVADEVRNRKTRVTGGHTLVVKAPGRQQKEAGRAPETWLGRNSRRWIW